MMSKVNVKIDGKDFEVENNITVLEACRDANIDIPTLCYLKDVNEIGACRMCLVEVKGARNLQASCVYPVREGLEILTSTEKVRKTRRENLELILSNHDRKCLTCVRNRKCELQKLAEDLGVEEISFEGEMNEYKIDDKSDSIVRDNNKCILCRRCVSMCKNIQKTNVISAEDRGFNTKIGSSFDNSLDDVECINCGQCIKACPVGALKEKSSIEKVFDAISDENTHIVVQTAPSVRVALGEEFGMEIGGNVTGKMVTALKMMGFDGVFDTNTAADLTIMEEGNELLHRLNNGGTLPMITSCSPGWVKYCEHHYPEFIANLSTCKSPMQMMGAMLKSYYAKNAKVEPKNMFVVAVMPCTAKKFEINREELTVDGLKDTDAVITTRELAKMIKQKGIDFKNLEDGNFDSPIGEASSAGLIFGTTGGVMEAALRTVYEEVTGDKLDKFEPARGKDGIKEFEVKLPNITLKAAVVSGTGKAKELLDKIKNKEAEYHFIEIMGCPGGCIMGGGQPIIDSKTLSTVDVFKLRANAIYSEDEKAVVRRSHENPYIKKLYDEFLGKPLGENSHKYLHTHYINRRG